MPSQGLRQPRAKSLFSWTPSGHNYTSNAIRTIHHDLIQIYHRFTLANSAQFAFPHGWTGCAAFLQQF